MRENEVEQRFADYLRGLGWSVVLRDPSFIDVIADHPDGTRLLAEVKGTTKDPGTDADILFGQLLRRMTDLSGTTRYAVVVPPSVLPAVERVPAEVRERLGIEVWLVTPEGEPREISEPPLARVVNANTGLAEQVQVASDGCALVLESDVGALVGGRI